MLVWGGALLHRRVREAAPDHLYLLLVGAPALLLPGRPDPPLIVLGWARDEHPPSCQHRGSQGAKALPGEEGRFPRKRQLEGGFLGQSQLPARLASALRIFTHYGCLTPGTALLSETAGCIKILLFVHVSCGERCTFPLPSSF